MAATSVDPTSKGALYSRNATGLVRQLSTFDSFVLCFSAVAVPIGMTQAFLFAPQLFPGVNMTLSFAIASVVALFFGLVYLYFTQMMPRSGGDYVWVSRILNPAVGFVIGSVSTFTPLQFTSLNLAVQTSIFLPALMELTGNNNYVLSKGAELAISMIATVVLCSVLLAGTKWVARITGALFVFVIAGLGVWLALLLFKSHGDFKAALDAHSSQSYAHVIAAARGTGFNTSSSLKSTLLGVVYGFQFFVGFQWIAYFAGEVRHASQTAKVAILGTWAVTAVSFIVASVLVYRFYGFAFLSSAGDLFSNHASLYKVPVPPYLSSFVVYLTGSTFLRYFIILSFLACVIWSGLTFVMVASRNIFAYSFDRVFPEKVAYVGRRTHAPVGAILVTMALVLLLDYLTVYTSFFGLLVNWVAVIAAATVVVSMTLVFMPKLRPELWERVPDELKAKWLGVYRVQIVGVIAALLELAILIVCLSTPSIGGVVTVKNLLWAFGVPIVAFIYFWINRAIRQRQGVNIDQAFAEIPSD
jgi:basic amino acid/polyamine antiporter, APA family